MVFSIKRIGMTLACFGAVAALPHSALARAPKAWVGTWEVAQGGGLEIQRAGSMLVVTLTMVIPGKPPMVGTSEEVVLISPTRLECSFAAKVDETRLRLELIRNDIDGTITMVSLREGRGKIAMLVEPSPAQLSARNLAKDPAPVPASGGTP